MARAGLNSSQVRTTRRPGRTMSLRVLPDGTLKVNAPSSASQRRISRFIEGRAAWIDKRLEEFDNLYDFSPQKRLASGLMVRVMTAERLGAVESQPGLITITKPVSATNWQAYQAARPLIKLRLAELAEPVFSSELAELAGLNGYSYSSYSIKFLRSRWGSCNHAGKIVLNSQLLRLPGRLRRYVIAHELAHLKIANHSPEFYLEVGNIIPSYRQRRKELKRFRLLH